MTKGNEGNEGNEERQEFEFAFPSFPLFPSVQIVLDFLCSFWFLLFMTIEDHTPEVFPAVVQPLPLLAADKPGTYLEPNPKVCQEIEFRESRDTEQAMIGIATALSCVEVALD